MAPKVDTSAIQPSSGTYVTTAVNSFFQIQLLSVSAGSSVSATGFYPPPPLKFGVALQRRDSLICVTKGAETRHFGTTVVLQSGTQNSYAEEIVFK